MYIDYQRARTVFGLMLDLYKRRAYPFINLEKDLPQNLVTAEIQSNPLSLARHLFFACHYMRGTVVSSHAFHVLNKMQEKHPWLFNEEILVLTTAGQVSDALGEHIPWHQVQVGKLWLANAHTLHREWGGDPRRIFSGSPSKKTLYKRVMGRKYKGYRGRCEGFGGFREKMTSMLAYFLESKNLITPTPLSAPVDFHHFRVYLATEMIRVKTDTVRYEYVKKLGIRLAEWLQREFSLSQVEYGDIVWLWSLRSCRSSPHNSSREVVLDTGQTRRIPVSITWSEGQLRSYARTCGRCYIADYCTYGVPAGPYYTTGLFHLLERQPPPQQNLFLSSELPPTGSVIGNIFLDRFSVMKYKDVA